MKLLPVNTYTILYFYSEGNSAQELNRVEKKIKESIPAIAFLKVNVSNNPMVSTCFHVQETPLLLVLQNGKEVWRQKDTSSEVELGDRLAQIRA